MTMEDKMNEFVPGIVEGQQEFYHVEGDGAVTRWWLVPGRHTSTVHGLADDHPLGKSPRPGWYGETGTPLPGDPREARAQIEAIKTAPKFDRSAAMKARARTPEGQALLARAQAANQTPEARAKRNATLARNKARREACATAPDQQEFYHVREDDGTVERWWIVPNTFGPIIYGPADEHPLGNSPLPGWYDSDGKALSRNPRTVVL